MPTVLRIELEPCINCSLCRRVCPTECITYYSTGHRTHIIDPSGCIGCDLCVRVCPADCIHPDPEYVIDPEELERAKAKARSFAGRQRRTKVALHERALAAVGAVGRG